MQDAAAIPAGFAEGAVIAVPMAARAPSRGGEGGFAAALLAREPPGAAAAMLQGDTRGGDSGLACIGGLRAWGLRPAPRPELWHPLAGGHSRARQPLPGFTLQLF